MKKYLVLITFAILLLSLSTLTLAAEQTIAGNVAGLVFGNWSGEFEASDGGSTSFLCGLNFYGQYGTNGTNDRFIIEDSDPVYKFSSLNSIGFFGGFRFYTNGFKGIFVQGNGGCDGVYVTRTNPDFFLDYKVDSGYLWNYGYMIGYKFCRDRGFTAEFGYGRVFYQGTVAGCQPLPRDNIVFNLGFSW